MPAQLLDGKKLSEEILNGLQAQIETMPTMKLGIITVGENPASAAYAKQKKKTGEKIGIEVEIFRFPSEITTSKLRAQVNKIHRLSGITGVIVQLPLPEHIKTQSILNAVPVSKDVDVLSQNSSGKLYLGTSPVLPPTVGAIMKILESNDIEIANKRVAIVGYGKLVGKPAVLAFTEKRGVVSIIRSSTPNPQNITQEADIIVTGVGKAGIITRDMVKEGAVIIDAGYMSEGGKVVGDVADDVADVVSYITPVPGGVGPVTVAMLFWNLVQLAK